MDPFHLPRWRLDLLHDAIEPLRAEELIASATAARVAWADRRGYTRFIRRLQRDAAPYAEEEPIELAETEEDKKRAAEFLRTMGITVIEGSSR